jgi:hypothetical protein
MRGSTLVLIFCLCVASSPSARPDDDCPFLQPCSAWQLDCAAVTLWVSRTRLQSRWCISHKNWNKLQHAMVGNILRTAFSQWLAATTATTTTAAAAATATTTTTAAAATTSTTTTNAVLQNHWQAQGSARLALGRAPRFLDAHFPTTSIDQPSAGAGG